MGEPNKLTSHSSKENKKKIAVNLANGGGIGVGVVFIGGALATATLVSALTVLGRRLLKKSLDSKNRNHCHYTESNETLEKFIAEDITTSNSTIKDEIKGLLQPFPPDMDQNLSNGTAKTSVAETDTRGFIISSKCRGETQNIGLYSGKGDLICDDKKILPTSGLHKSDGSRQCDGSDVETGQFSLPVVEDQKHFQPANMKEDSYGGEIEIIKEQSTSKIPDVDHSTNEGSQLMQVNNEEKVREVKCKEAAETAEADQREELSQAFKTVENLEGAAAAKAVHVEKGHGNSMMLMMEEKERNCIQREVWLTTESAEQQKRRLEAAHAHPEKVNGGILMFEEEKICSQHGNGSLIFQTEEVVKSHEKFDEDQADEGNSGLLIVPTVEVHDGLTVENDRRLEEDKAIELAQGTDKTEILMLEKGRDAPRDDENDVAGQAATLAVESDSVACNDLPKQLYEEQGNPPAYSQVHFVYDITTFENVQCENSGAQDPNLCLESAQGDSSQFQGGSGIRSNLKEIKLFIEASVTREENVSSEPGREESEDRAIERDTKPLKQSIGNALDEIEDAPATPEADSVSVTGQMAVSEEDSMDDDTDETNIKDKVEENSEGTGDSSAEYNTEPIWPAESLEELSMDFTGLKFHNQIENQLPEENKTLQTEAELHSNDVEDRGISVESLQNVNEGEGGMLELAEQNDQQSNSWKLRNLDLKWTFMVLLWPLCFWYFGMPYFKISFIVILVILLSKIQGT